MKKIFVIGSSSSVAKAIEQSALEFEVVFYGRTNPYDLKGFIEWSGVSDEASVDALLLRVLDEIKTTPSLESVDLIILSGVSSHDWRESFLVNEYLPAVLAEGFARFVSEEGGLKASVTLVGSAAAYQGAKLPYATTKASLVGILHALAKEYRHKVRVNLVIPSAFDSAMIADWDDTKRQAVAESNYVGRIGTAEDMADAILFTVRNEFITNSTLNMTGGTVHI